MSSFLRAPALSLALLLALVVPAALATPAQAHAPAEARSAAAGTCTSTALGARKAIRTKAGTKLGTARMYAATAGADRGFCVRITPIARLRSRYTIAGLKNVTYDPDGTRSSSGQVGGSGAWKHPFLVTGNILVPGSSMKGVASLQPSGGRKGTVTLRGTLS